MADSKKYNGSTWEHSLRKLTTATDTFTTLPVEIYADGNNATVGLKGNTVQSGTPTPESPVMPEGCGDITANMLSVYKKNYSINANGEEKYNDVAMIYKANVSVSGSTFTLDFGGLSAGDTVRIHAYTGDIWKEQIASIVITQVPFAFTVASEVDNIRVSIRKTATDVSLTDGQYKIPILSAAQTTSIYLGEAQATRKIKKLVLTGAEVFAKNDPSNPLNYLYYQTGYLANEYCFCTHLDNMGTLSPSKVGVFNGNNVLYLNFGSAIMGTQPSGNTVTGLKEYLAAQYTAGTPVTVWYVLAEPETAVVNEPLMKIGNYADTVSGITIPTTTGADSFDVQTTLKPSEASLSYTGWHDATVKEWDGSQWNE